MAAEPAAGHTIASQLPNAAMSAAMEERMLRLLHRSSGDRQDIAAAIARALQAVTDQHEAAVVLGQEATLSPRFIDLWISQVAEPRELESGDIVWMVHRELLQRYGMPVEWQPSDGPYVPPQQPAPQQQQPAPSHDQRQQMPQQQEQQPAVYGQQQQRPNMQQQESPDVGSESDDEPPRPTRVTQSRAERKQRRNFAVEAGETGDFLGDDEDMEEGTLPPRQQPRAPQLPQSLEEMEARLKPGTIKHCALQVLKGAGSRGMAIDDIMAAVSAQGLRQWDANSKRVVQFALSSDEAFVRTSKGVYALSCLAGISQRPTARNPRSQKKPRRHAVDEGWDGEMNGYPDDGAPDGWSYEDSRLDPYTRAEKALSRAQAAIVEQRSRLEKAHVAVEEAEAKAAAAERKAKAAAPSKRKRESAALVAQHAALVAVADAIPQVAAVLTEQHAAQQAKRQARGSQSPAAQPAEGVDIAGAADGQQAQTASGQQAGEQAGLPPQQQQEVADAVAGAAELQAAQPGSSAAPQQQQQQHLQQSQPQQPQQSAAMLQQQHSVAMAQLAAAGLPSMPMFNPAVPATAQFPLGGAPPFGLGPGDGGVWAQILASLPSASGGPDAQQALPGSWLRQQSAALAAAQQAGSPAGGDPQGAAQHRQHQQPQQQHQPQQQQSDDPPDMAMMEAVVNALPGSGEMVETPNGVLEMPDFGLTEAEKEYHGPPDDRRALMAHRKWLQEEMDKRDEIRERWLRKVQGRKGRAVAQRGKEAAAAQRQARRAAEAVSAAERALAAAEAAAVEAEKNLEREALRRLSAGGRGGAAARERDRRRAAAEAARKFPMEDAALMALLNREAAEAGEALPDFSVPGPPEVLPQTESDRLAPALFVADFLGHFGRAIGIRRMPLAELQRRLGLPDHMASLQRGDESPPAAAAEPGPEAEAATGVQPTSKDPAQQQLAGDLTSAAQPQAAGGALDTTVGQPSSTAAATEGPVGADGTATAAVKPEWDPNAMSAAAAARDEAEDCSLAPVYALYEALLRMLLQDCAAAGKAGRMERRWDAILGPGTWPEVLRRYALNRSAKAPGGIVGEVVLGAVAMLGGGPVVDLTAEQHLALLSFLCDEALDTALLRNLLQKRLEDADALRRHAKGGLAEERRRQKGPRSRKSAGSMVSTASLKAERDGSVLRDEDAASVGLADAGEGTPQPDSQPGGAAELERKQEELDQQLDLCCVRRAPLGADRLGVRYWWGLASQQAAVWVEAPPAPEEQQQQQQQQQQQPAADAAADNKATKQEAAQQGNGQALVHQPQLPPQPSPARQAKEQQQASPQRQLLHQQHQQAMSPQQQLLMQLHAQQQAQQLPQAQLETHLRLQQELALLQQRQAAIAHFPPEQRSLLQQQVNAHLAELQVISASLGAFPHQHGGSGFANGGGGLSGGVVGLQNGGSIHVDSNSALLLPGIDQQTHQQQQQHLDLASWRSGGHPAGFSLSGFGSPPGGVSDHAAANAISAPCNADGLRSRQRKQDAEEQLDRFGAISWPLRDPAPVWGMLTEAGQLEAVAAALDERGERDAALLGTLQKRLPEISAAMAEGHTAVAYSDDEYDRAAAAPVRQSRRIAGPGDAADGGSGRAGLAGRARPGSGGSHDIQHGVKLELPAVESAALAAAAEQLSALCTAATEFGIPEPPGGWQRLEAAVHAVVIGQAPGVAAADPRSTDTLERRTLEALRSAAGEAEDAMWAAACTAASEYARNTGQSVANLVGAEIDAAARAGQSRKKGDGSDSEADFDEDADAVADRASSRGEAADGDADGYDSEGGSPGADRDASEPLPDGGVLQVLELSDGEEEKKALKRSGGRPSRARGAPRLWRSLRERALWRVDLAAAGTIPRVAYCCIVLAVCGGELLETLEARQRRAEQRRSSRIPLNPPPLAGRAAEKARKAAAAADAEVAELGQRRRKAAGSYQVLAGKGFGGY